MAGPAIRCLELGRQLQDEFIVTLFSPHGSRDEHQPHCDGNIRIVTGKGHSELLELASEHDILFIQANVLKAYPALSSLGKYMVVDLYDPYLLSLLVQYQDKPESASASFRLMHKVLERHMLAADFCVCASERQRDYWLGRFCALGRINPDLHRVDPSLRKLIDVVPFGLPDEPPRLTGVPLKQRIPGISPDDRVLIWGGGIWEWFDPLTVIRAVAKLSAEIPGLRLVFMGLKSPNPQVDLMDMAVKAKKLSSELGVLDRHVFFLQDWIPYEDRVNYLLDADIAVSCHFDVIETRFSFRTRILDYLWCGLPVLTTGGDEFSELIDRRGAGTALPFGDVDAWARAIAKILSNQEWEQSCRRASSMLAREFVWSSAAKNLRRFCREPYHLPQFTRVTMPSIFERAHAVYCRGGTDLLLRRSREILADLLK